MKPIVFGILFWTTILCFPVCAGNKVNSGITLRIVKVNTPAILTVEIGNPSKKPIRIWQEWNSWGAAHWRVLVIRKEHVFTFYQNPDQIFTKNFPACDEIKEGGYIRKELNLMDKQWCCLEGSIDGFMKGDIIIVIYDVPKLFHYPEASITVKVRRVVWCCYCTYGCSGRPCG